MIWDEDDDGVNGIAGIAMIAFKTADQKFAREIMKMYAHKNVLKLDKLLEQLSRITHFLDYTAHIYPQHSETWITILMMTITMD